MAIMNGLNLRWRAYRSQNVVRPCCCPAVAGMFYDSSTQATREYSQQDEITKARYSRLSSTQQCPQIAAADLQTHHQVCNTTNSQHSEKQQLWLTQQHDQMLLQMQIPAQQVHQELIKQEGLQPVGVQSVQVQPAGRIRRDHTTSYTDSFTNTSSTCIFSRPTCTRHAGYIVAAAAAGAGDPSTSGSSASSISSTSSSKGGGGSSASLKNIRERMRQRVTSRVTQSSQHHAQQVAAAATTAAATTSAAPGGAPAPPSAATSKRLPPILPSTSNETSISDVLQQLQQKLGNSKSKQGAQSRGQPSSSSGVSSTSIGKDDTAARKASDAAFGRKKRQQDQQSALNSKEPEQREFMAQQRLQLLHQEQQQRKWQQLMQKARMKEQRAAAFKHLQASADAVLKQHAAASATKNPSAASQQHVGITTGKSTSNNGSGSSKALKPGKAQAYTQQFTSRRRTGRRTAADPASAVVAAAAAAAPDSTVPARPGLRRTIPAAAAAHQQPDHATAAGAATAAATPTPKQLAVQLGLDVALVKGLSAMLAKTEAPYVIQQQLLADYAAGKPGIPRNPTFLARRLMHFSQAAELLGGPDRACNILERDTSLLLMPPALMQRKLLNLQLLLAEVQDAEYLVAAAAPVDQASAGSSDSGRAASVAASSSLTSVNSNSSSSETAGSSRSFRPSAEVLGLVRSHPGLLHLSVAGLQQRLAALQNALGVGSIQEVVQVVRWQPRVLSMNEEALQDKVWGLAATIRVPPASIQPLFTKQPLLLNLSAGTLSQKASALKLTLGLSAQQLWEMLCCKPGVLLFSSSKISRKWAALQQLADSHPRWRSELAELSPSSLVQLLTASEARLARLHHVVAVGGQDWQALYYTVSHQSERRFKARFQTYDAWLAQGKRKQQGTAIGAGFAVAGGTSAGR